MPHKDNDGDEDAVLNFGFGALEQLSVIGVTDSSKQIGYLPETLKSLTMKCIFSADEKCVSLELGPNRVLPRLEYFSAIGVESPGLPYQVF